MTTYASQVAIATVFLDEQLRRCAPTGSVKAKYRPLKALIEQWAGTYISEKAVDEAAQQLGLPGDYPAYDMPSLILPSVYRIRGNPEIFRHSNFAASMCNAMNSYLKRSYSGKSGRDEYYISVINILQERVYELEQAAKSKPPDV